MSTTRIFLDVDGVLNAVSKETPTTGWEQYGWYRTTVNGYTITYNVELVETLNDISLLDNVEIVWLTTWQSNAASLIAPAIGLIGQDWDVVDNPDTDPHGYALQENRGSWWKAIVLQEHLKNSPADKIIWVDDDLSFYPAARNWAENLDIPALLVAPWTSEGLTPGDICAMIDFINEG